MDGLCKGCGMKKQLTEHHVIPKRLKVEDPRRIYLCRECHDILEVLIAKLERKILLRNQWIYHRVTRHFN